MVCCVVFGGLVVWWCYVLCVDMIDVDEVYNMVVCECVLCDVVWCCLSCVMLCCSVICCDMVCGGTLYSVKSCHDGMCCIWFDCIVLYESVLHYYGV